MNKILKQLRLILSGNFLKDPKVRHYYPFLLFIAIFAMIYIANTYHSINMLRKIDKANLMLETEDKKLKDEEINYTNRIKQSNLVEILEEKEGIKEAKSGVYKIIVD